MEFKFIGKVWKCHEYTKIQMGYHGKYLSTPETWYSEWVAYILQVNKSYE